MNTPLETDGYVRSARAAFISALPGFILLTFYLWIGVAVLDGIVYGLTGSLYVTIGAAVAMAVPAVIAMRHLAALCIEAERRIR